MINAPLSWGIEEYKDIESINYHAEVKARTNDDPVAMKEVMRSLQILGRDHSRLPMQWDSTPFSGFTGCEKGGWMRTHDGYKEINVAKQIDDPKSVLSFWKKMLRMRKQYRDLFIYGAYEAFQMGNQETFIFGKKFGEQRAVVVLNFTGVGQVFLRPEVEGEWSLLVGNVEGVVGGEEMLGPWEGRIYLVGGV